jgi:hypothetical protein
MGYGEPVSIDIWHERYQWLRGIEEKAQNPLGSYLVSSQAAFISYDLEIAFCAGAWVSVIILAHAVIDATIRDTEVSDYRSNSKTIFGGDPDLEWLRDRRNSLVHVRKDYDPSDFDAIDDHHMSLENDARRAMILIFRTFYANPGN